jgi:hypothetical protein
MAGRVRERSGQKGKALFHPIRLALTGEAEGLELDIAVPAIERGAALGGPKGPPLHGNSTGGSSGGEADREVRRSGIKRIAGAAARAAEFAAAMRRERQ